MFREALVECSSLRIDWEVELMVDNLLSPDLGMKIKCGHRVTSGYRAFRYSECRGNALSVNRSTHSRSRSMALKHALGAELNESACRCQ